MRSHHRSQKDSGAQSLSTAKRIVERLRSSEESDEHEVQWATRVLAAIQRAMDASASEQRGPKLALQRKQSFLDRANRTVEMAVNRATKKKLSRRFSSAISMDSSTSRTGGAACLCAHTHTCTHPHIGPLELTPHGMRAHRRVAVGAGGERSACGWRAVGGLLDG